MVRRREGHVITTATSQHRLNTCLISDTTRAIHFTIKERQGTAHSGRAFSVDRQLRAITLRERQRESEAQEGWLH